MSVKNLVESIATQISIIEKRKRQLLEVSVLSEDQSSAKNLIHAVRNIPMGQKLEQMSAADQSAAVLNGRNVLSHPDLPPEHLLDYLQRAQTEHEESGVEPILPVNLSGFHPDVIARMLPFKIMHPQLARYAVTKGVAPTSLKYNENRATPEARRIVDYMTDPENDVHEDARNDLRAAGVMKNLGRLKTEEENVSDESLRAAVKGYMITGDGEGLREFIRHHSGNRGRDTIIKILHAKPPPGPPTRSYPEKDPHHISPSFLRRMHVMLRN